MRQLSMHKAMNCSNYSNIFCKTLIRLSSIPQGSLLNILTRPSTLKRYKVDFPLPASSSMGKNSSFRSRTLKTFESVNRLRARDIKGRL